MSVNGVLIGAVGGILTFIIAGEATPLIVTNVLLGFIVGKLTDNK